MITDGEFNAGEKIDGWYDSPVTRTWIPVRMRDGKVSKLPAKRLIPDTTYAPAGKAPTTEAAPAVPSQFKLLKTIPSHSGYARFLGQTSDIGFIPRVKDIPSPYVSSPTDRVMDWNGRKVISRETSHRRYQVFEVPPETQVYASDDEATKAAFPRWQSPARRDR